MEIPHLEAFHQERANHGLQLISLGNDFQQYSCQEWANIGASYPIIDDRGTAIWSLFGSGVVPRNVIIDKDGVVRYNSAGFNTSAITDILDALTTSIVTEQKPLKIRLLGNYPNPFNAGTQIKLQLEETSLISLNIYSIKGHNVRTLIKGNLSEGDYSIDWNGRDDSDKDVPGGIYIIQLLSGDRQESKRALLLK